MTKNKKTNDKFNPDDYASSVWDFESEEQKKKMLEPILKDNCGQKLKLVREVSGISRRGLAGVFDISESTMCRLETGKSKPTKDFMLKLAGLVAIGHAKYSKMNKSERKKLAQYLGAAGGITTGVGGSIAVVSTAGVAGTSAAGITSGLAAIGGGTMLGGIAVIASIPLALGAAGFGLVKGFKAICKANKLNCKEVDGRYEITPEPPSQKAENLDEQ